MALAYCVTVSRVLRQEPRAPSLGPPSPSIPQDQENSSN